MNRKIISLGLICCLGMSMLTGCEQKKVDYGLGGNTENTKNSEARVDRGKKSLEQFANAEKWVENLQAQNSKGETIELEINAEVSVPSAEQMYVVEVEETDMDEDYKRKVAERIFGDETVYYNDYRHLPKIALESQMYSYQSKYDFYSEHEEESEENAEKAKELSEKLEDCEELIKVAKDTYTPVTDYTVNEYWGERNGIKYLLNFEDEGGSDSQNLEFVGYMSLEGKGRMKGFSLAPEDIYDTIPEGITLGATDDEWGLVSWFEGSPGDQGYEGKENQCKLSQEEAQELAQNFVDTLGRENMVASCNPLCWGMLDQMALVTLNGYVFTYHFGIEGNSFDSYGREYEYSNYVSKKKESEEAQYSLDTSLKLYVTDQGVIEAYCYNPIELAGLSESVELLPMDAIKGIMEKELTTEMGQFRFAVKNNKVSFSDMQLIYFRVRDREHEGRYSYIPTWRLSHTLSRIVEWRDGKPISQVIMIDNPVLINAIDGSVINLYDEL